MIEPQTLPLIKISKADWRALPAWLKRQIDVPRVLTRLNGVSTFVPVQII